MRHFRWVFIFILIGFVPLRAAASTDEAKAQYLYGLVKFVQWPSEDSQADVRTPITIGVIGLDHLEEALNSISKDQTWEGRAFQVKGFRSADPAFGADFRLCNVLYIAPSEKQDLPGLLKVLKGSSSLTVSDMKNFNVMGGMVELGDHGSQVTSTVYLDPVSATGIFVHPKFLRIAKTPLRTEYFGRPSGR